MRRQRRGGTALPAARRGDMGQQVCAVRREAGDQIEVPGQVRCPDEERQITANRAERRLPGQRPVGDSQQDSEQVAGPTRSRDYRGAPGATDPLESPAARPDITVPDRRRVPIVQGHPADQREQAEAEPAAGHRTVEQGRTGAQADSPDPDPEGVRGSGVPELVGVECDPRRGIEQQQRLCELERSAGQLVVAERHCHDALALALDLRGPEHPTTIDARRQLAAIHVDQGRFAEADKAFRDSHALLVARLGRQHQDVARNDNSLGIIAWERGDAETALAHIDRALAVLRKQPEAPLYQNVLFNKAMILHDAGRDRAALPLLLQVDGLRVATLDKGHPRNGETARLLGEVRAALGETSRAREDLVLAVQLTRGGYGLTHPHTRRAELSLAQFDLAHGDPPAPSVVNQLRLLADLPKSDPELRKIAWLAEAALALQACKEPGFGDGRERLDAVAAEIAVAMPEGGVVALTFERERQRCR